MTSERISKQRIQAARHSRRGVLAGLLAGAAAPALANAPTTSLRPEPRPGGEAAQARVLARLPSPERLVEEARLGPTARVACVVADAGTGEVLESLNPVWPQPPASVAKAITALYALDRLGPAHRFETQVLASGPVSSGGRLNGDLILAGSGDPLLDTNALATLAARLKEAGVNEVTGRFLLWEGALPRIDRIDPGQPDHVGYNPAVSGLNLNFNRVHFEWRRAGSGYAVSMDARSDRYRPDVRVARMQVVSRSTPVYTYADAGPVDEWTVASGALGNGGARWLPVREPALYAGEVFQTFARAQGIALPAPAPSREIPSTATALASVRSDGLESILQGMLRYSTNITAEAVGLAASAVVGGVPGTLADSAGRMSDWMAASIGSRRPDFVDHSGLGDQSRITCADMVRAFVHLGPRANLAPILRDISLRNSNYEVIEGSRVQIAAKTGTLNFVSGLGGYATAPGGRRLAFAIFAADTERRAGIPRAQRDNADGARPWARRARILQHRLLGRWTTAFA